MRADDQQPVGIDIGGRQDVECRKVLALEPGDACGPRYEGPNRVARTRRQAGILAGEDDQHTLGWCILCDELDRGKAGHDVSCGSNEIVSRRDSRPGAACGDAGNDGRDGPHCKARGRRYALFTIVLRPSLAKLV